MKNVVLMLFVISLASCNTANKSETSTMVVSRQKYEIPQEHISKLLDVISKFNRKLCTSEQSKSGRWMECAADVVECYTQGQIKCGFRNHKKGPAGVSDQVVLIENEPLQLLDQENSLVVFTAIKESMSKVPEEGSIVQLFEFKVKRSESGGSSKGAKNIDSYGSFSY